MSDRAETGGKLGRGRFRADPDDLGRVFGKLLAASAVSLWLSLVLLVVVALASSAEHPTLTVTDFPVFVVIGSWIGMWASLLGYCVWSFWQLRRMRDDRTRPTERNPFKRVYYLLALTFEAVDDPSNYEKRLQLTLQSFVFGIIVLVVIPLAVVTG